MNNNVLIEKCYHISGELYHQQSGANDKYTFIESQIIHKDETLQ